MNFQGTDPILGMGSLSKLFINRVSLKASKKLSTPIKVAWFNVVGTSKKLIPNAMTSGITLNNNSNIMDGAINTYALLEGLFQ